MSQLLVGYKADLEVVELEQYNKISSKSDNQNFTNNNMIAN